MSKEVIGGARGVKAIGKWCFNDADASGISSPTSSLVAIGTWQGPWLVGNNPAGFIRCVRVDTITHITILPFSQTQGVANVIEFLGNIPHPYRPDESVTFMGWVLDGGENRPGRITIDIFGKLTMEVWVAASLDTGSWGISAFPGGVENAIILSYMSTLSVA